MRRWRRFLRGRLLSGRFGLRRRGSLRLWLALAGFCIFALIVTLILALVVALVVALALALILPLASAWRRRKSSRNSLDGQQRCEENDCRAYFHDFCCPCLMRPLGPGRNLRKGR